VYKAAEQTRRLARLLDQLLDSSRFSSGQMLLERESCNLTEVVRECASRFTDEAARAGTEIRLHLADGTIAHWDAFRIDQVVTNLLSNAIKYGSGKPIDVELHNDSGAVRLVVRDRGIGIRPGDSKRIFERFERSVSGHNYRGLGLGLYIANQIVKAHGGRITVESAVGAGATFVVELPMEAVQDSSPPSTPSSDEPESLSIASDRERS
jgi:signal transduction histidine kinase